MSTYQRLSSVISEPSLASFATPQSPRHGLVIKSSAHTYIHDISCDHDALLTSLKDKCSEHTSQRPAVTLVCLRLSKLYLKLCLIIIFRFIELILTDEARLTRKSKKNRQKCIHTSCKVGNYIIVNRKSTYINNN